MTDRHLAASITAVGATREALVRLTESIEQTTRASASRLLAMLDAAQIRPDLGTRVRQTAAQMLHTLDVAEEHVAAAIGAELAALELAATAAATRAAEIASRPPKPTRPPKPSRPPRQHRPPKPSRPPKPHRPPRPHHPPRIEPAPPAGARYGDGPATLMPATIDIYTPMQGPLTNCHFIGPLCLATGRRPRRVASFVQEDGPDIVVRTPHDEQRITRALPFTPEGGRRHASTNDGSGLVPYLEKAFAQFLNGYPEIDQPRQPEVALTWPTGSTPTTVRPQALTDRKIRRLCRSNRLTVAGTYTAFDAYTLGIAVEYGIVAEHIYAVRGVDHAGNILLHNPWGRRHPKPIPLKVLRRTFGAFVSVRWP